jgi:hypothetical protein
MARVAFEMESNVRSTRHVGVEGKRPTLRVSVEGGNIRQVLDPDRNSQILILLIHEEAINQFTGMAYFGRVFSSGEVSLRAMNSIPKYPYP